MKPSIRRTIFAALVLLASAGGCRLYNLEKNLAPPYAEFLSQVRYIITSEERKIFLETPDSDKDGLIEEFWKRRDPDPLTEENEFKMEYEERIQKATEIFLGEGIPGWLTDRGRIWILFGPPMDRLTNPAGRDAYGRCGETWYYGNFPVVFLDDGCTGRFKLVTYDLTALRELNLMYMHALNLAQAEAQKTFAAEKKFFDYQAGLKIAVRTSERIEGVVRVELPYARIWFKSEGERMVTTFDVALELRDAKKALVWETKTSFEVVLVESELESKSKKNHVHEFAFAVDDPAAIARLGQGKDQFILTLANRTGGETLRKVLVLK
ncbi:MAG: GWxTD domain-containing protein [Candidatus Aminicenantes bacterium]|nr:GWxTD domain-containing protein [Candidatus Aminicenantes bacterium]